MVEAALRVWRKRGVHTELFSNTPLRNIRFTYLEHWDDFLKCHSGVVLLDELGVWASSRDSMSLPWSVRAMLAQHRHQGLDLYYTAQNINRVDTIIRELTTHIYICVRIPLTRRVIRWKMDPMDPKTKLGANTIKMTPDIWKIYDTSFLVNDPSNRSRFEEGQGKLYQEMAPVALRGCERVCDCGEVPCWCNHWQYRRTDPNRGIYLPIS